MKPLNSIAAFSGALVIAAAIIFAGLALFVWWLLQGTPFA